MVGTTELIDTVLITGAAGGIGKGLAQYFVSQKKKVIIVGRTESKLKTALEELGADSYYVLDTGDTQSISTFVSRVTKEHPDLNCLVNNAGIQLPFNFPGADSTEYNFDLARADEEIDINIKGYLHLTLEFLPHFTSLSKTSVIINVSSLLGFFPFITYHPVYNATKAWQHSFTLNLRTQYEKGGKLKVVEIIPPSVETDLHRDRTDPDDNKKHKNDAVLSMDEFMNDVAPGLESGQDEIAPGISKEVVEEWQNNLGVRYKKAVAGK